MAEVKKKKSLAEIVAGWWHNNPLAQIGREYPIHLSNLPGNNIIIVATRAPKSPLSGGMAPAVKEACSAYDTKFWYAYGETPVRGALTRILMGAFNGYYKKNVDITAYDVEGFRVRQVSAEKSQWDLQYNQYCNRWIWPICHNLNDFAKELEHWDTYGNRDANERIAKRIKSDLNGDKNTPIWIHDYHHLTLAQALRRHGVENPVLYFHHIPLPTMETLERQGKTEKAQFIEMVNSLKACDAVLFQTEEVAKRYMALVGETIPDSIPAYEGKFIASNANGRESRQVFIGHAPISINTQKILDVANGDQTLKTKNARELDDKLVAPNVFINFERCDYSKGILERVRAYKALLEQNPDLRGSTQLVLGAEPTRSDIEEYKQYAEDVKTLVEEICHDEDLWVEGQPPVIFVNEHVEHSDLIRLMRNRKEGQRRIGLITPHEDGMNLTAKEHAAAQDINNAAPTILSSGAGTASELLLDGKGALVYPKVNGHEVQVLADAMLRAVQMPQEEANDRAKAMQDHLVTHDIERWGQYSADLLQSIQEDRFYPSPDISVDAAPRAKMG